MIIPSEGKSIVNPMKDPIQPLVFQRLFQRLFLWLSHIEPILCARPHLLHAGLTLDEGCQRLHSGNITMGPWDFHGNLLYIIYRVGFVGDFLWDF